MEVITLTDTIYIEVEFWQTKIGNHTSCQTKKGEYIPCQTPFNIWMKLTRQKKWRVTSTYTYKDNMSGKVRACKILSVKVSITCLSSLDYTQKCLTNKEVLRNMSGKVRPCKILSAKVSFTCLSSLDFTQKCLTSKEVLRNMSGKVWACKILSVKVSITCLLSLDNT